jgi:16S rRNA (guanine527-N7)-methyltransferase
MKVRQKPAEKIWEQFAEQEGLSAEQVDSFMRYADFLLQRNEEINLTAITDLSGVVRQHFQDSLVLRKFIDLSSIKVLCDIGTGAGFPAIPLKIIYPHLRILLIEVTKKKLLFLEELIEVLSLDNIILCDLDWRTFVRKVEEPIDLFVSRAAMDELELTRIYRPACHFNTVPLVYWVSFQWEPHPKVVSLIQRIEFYKLAKKERKLVFFAHSTKKNI